MARNDIKIKDPIDGLRSFTAVVSSGGATTINAGEPTKCSTVGAVAICIDTDGSPATRFAGIAKYDSTDTVAAAGECVVWMPVPGLVYSGKATTAANADTKAEIDALFGKRVIFDLTSTAWTVDTGATDTATNGLVIIGGDFNTSTIWFVVSPSCTVFE